MRAAAGVYEIRNLKVARLGDNMRQVAVTEGDKVEAQVRLGVEVNGYGVGELVRAIAEVSDAAIDRLLASTRSIQLDRPTAERRPAASRAARLGPHGAGPAGSSSKRVVSRLHRHLRGPSRARAASRAGRAATDGGRLWLRRRRRLEDGRAGRAMKVMARGCRAALRSWRTTPIISIRPGPCAGPYAGDLPFDGSENRPWSASAWHRR